MPPKRAASTSKVKPKPAVTAAASGSVSGGSDVVGKAKAAAAGGGGGGGGGLDAKKKLSPTVLKVHEAVLKNKNKQMSQEELKNLPEMKGDTKTLSDVINSLLKVGLLKLLRSKDTGATVFEATSRAEAKTVGLLEQDEGMVFQTIAGSKNSGIWQKSITRQTGLHDTTVTKAIKSLVQKQLIKMIKDVKTPTKKIWMLADLEPSEAVSGGPWMGDRDLDEEFIKIMRTTIMRYLNKETFGSTRPSTFLPISMVKQLPSAHDVLEFVKRIKVTTTELSTEDIESLLESLVDDDYATKIVRRRVEDEDDDEGDEGDDDDAEWDEVETEEWRPDDDDDGARSRKKRKTLKDEEDEEMEIDGINGHDDAGLDSSPPPLPPPVKFDFIYDDGAGAKRENEEEEEQAEAFVSKSKKRKIQDVDGTATAANGSEPRIKKPPPGTGPYYYVYKANRRLKKPKETGPDQKADPEIIRPVEPTIGWLDMPCGNCPVFEFCEQRGKPIVVDPLTPSISSLAAAANVGISKSHNSISQGGGRVKTGRGVTMSTMGRVNKVLEIGGAIKSSATGGDEDERPYGGMGWGRATGEDRNDVAPVNPGNCRYFREWLDF